MVFVVNPDKYTVTVCGNEFATTAVDAVVVPICGVVPYVNHQLPDCPCGLTDPTSVTAVEPRPETPTVATSGSGVSGPPCCGEGRNCGGSPGARRGIGI